MELKQNGFGAKTKGFWSQNLRFWDLKLNLASVQITKTIMTQ